jgi:hypothetical protein
MSAWLAVLIFAGYYGISLAIGRIRAELGLPVHDLHFAGPDTMAVNVLGSRLLGPGNTIVAALFWGFNRAYRNHPMPHQAEALHISARTDMTERATFLALTIALFLGCMAAMPIYAGVAYRYGAAAKMPPHIVWRVNEVYAKLAGRIDLPSPYDPKSLAAIVVGFVALAGGMALKTRLPWWPIHPIGFAVSGTWSMQLLWCPMAIGWVVKSCAVRYGGYQVMRRIAPIAFGLMLGDISGGCLWAILGMLKNKTFYMIWE